MKRRQAREMVLQSLFQMDYNKKEVADVEAVDREPAEDAADAAVKEAVDAVNEEAAVEEAAGEMEPSAAGSKALEVSEEEMLIKEALELQDDKEAPDNAVKYAASVLSGTVKNMAEIDARIEEFTKDWTLERMTGVDRNIIRMAVYETCFADERIPVQVAINEAVELAKDFGTEQSPRFVNGILGKLTDKYCK